MRCVVGIDPGLNGAVAIWRGENFARLVPTPTGAIKKGSREYDVKAMWAVLRDLPSDTEVSLERQWAQVRQTPTGPRREGSVQSFRLGWGYGIWYALVIAVGFRLYQVAPITWKKH